MPPPPRPFGCASCVRMRRGHGARAPPLPCTHNHRLSSPQWRIGAFRRGGRRGRRGRQRRPRLGMRLPLHPSMRHAAAARARGACGKGRRSARHAEAETAALPHSPVVRRAPGHGLARVRIRSSRCCRRTSRRCVAARASRNRARFPRGTVELAIARKLRWCAPRGWSLGSEDGSAPQRGSSKRGSRGAAGTSPRLPAGSLWCCLLAHHRRSVRFSRCRHRRRRYTWASRLLRRRSHQSRRSRRDDRSAAQVPAATTKHRSAWRRCFGVAAWRMRARSLLDGDATPWRSRCG